MDDAHALPDDLNECHRLLLAAFKQATELERVLDKTAASYEELQKTHQAALEELDRPEALDLRPANREDH